MDFGLPSHITLSSDATSSVAMEAQDEGHGLQRDISMTSNGLIRRGRRLPSAQISDRLLPGALYSPFHNHQASLREHMSKHLFVTL